MPAAGLPRVDVIASLLGADAPHALRVAAARVAIAEARRAVLSGGAMPDDATIAIGAEAWLAARARPTLRRVINATGVLVHTNLGRAPLPPEAVAPALGYCNLEYDVATGQRGSRRSLVEPLILELTGAEAALVVNNGAAALVLALASMGPPSGARAPGSGLSGAERSEGSTGPSSARPSEAIPSGARAPGSGLSGAERSEGSTGPSSARPSEAIRSIIISRGELVEIGGSFRIPEIIESIGVSLREVGTTNRTFAADYERAIGPDTLAILRVHPSNFRLSGFTARPSLGELATIAERHGLPFLVDLGSDALWPLPLSEPGEDTLAGALAAGADVVMLSGDKLLGGPQAGLAVGKAPAIERMARHPLMRALRPDKLALAALEYVLRARAGGHPERVPLLRMLAMDQPTLLARAERLAAELARSGHAAEVVPTADPVGGGSHPETTLPGAGLALSPPAHLGLDAWHAALRTGDPPVIATLVHQRLVIALRTVPEADEPDLLRALVTTLDSARPLI